MSRLKKWTLAFLGTSVAALVGYKIHSAHVAASAPAPHPNTVAREDLQKFMQSRVHQEYTFLSYTIWHDRPLTPAKMDSIATSSSKVIAMAQELNKYEATYKDQGWNNDDLKFFENKRLQLSRVAEELNHAAQKAIQPQSSISSCIWTVLAKAATNAFALSCNGYEFRNSRDNNLENNQFDSLARGCDR